MKFCLDPLGRLLLKQESIQVGCVVRQWPPLDISTDGGRHRVGVGIIVLKWKIWTGLQWWPPDVTSNRMGIPGIGYAQGWVCPEEGGISGGYPYHVIYPMMLVMLRTTLYPYHVTYPMMLVMLRTTLWTVRWQWKHYLLATTIVGGKILNPFLSEISLSGLYLWEERRPRIRKPCHEVFYCNTRCTRLVIYTPRASLCFQLKLKIYGSLSWFSKASTRNNWWDLPRSHLSTNNAVFVWQEKLGVSCKQQIKVLHFMKQLRSKYWLGLAASIHKSMNLLWNNPSSYEYVWNHII